MSKLITDFVDIMNFKLRFIILILTSTIPLNLFLNVISFITQHIYFCYPHLSISFHPKFSLLVEVLLLSVLYLCRGVHIMSPTYLNLKPEPSKDLGRGAFRLTHRVKSGLITLPKRSQRQHANNVLFLCFIIHSC